MRQAARQGPASPSLHPAGPTLQPALSRHCVQHLCTTLLTVTEKGSLGERAPLDNRVEGILGAKVRVRKWGWFCWALSRRDVSDGQ